MRKTAGSSKYFLTLDKELVLYRKEDMAQIASYPAAGMVAYYLHDEYLFVATREGRLQAIRLPMAPPITVVEFPRTRIVSVYARDRMLCVGTESGTLQTYLFNEEAFVLQKEYQHGAPVTGLASDGIVYFVTDHRDRVTEYPSGHQWDMRGPRLYSGKYLMCVEGRRIYIKTKGALSVFYEGPGEIEDVLFSEKGGFLFIVSGGRAACLDTSTLETRCDYAVENPVIVNDAIVNWRDGNFEVIDLFLIDKEMGEVAARNIQIREKRIGELEYERKYAFVQDGHSKSLPGKKEGRPRPVAQKAEPAKQPGWSLDGQDEAEAPSKRTRRLDALLSEETDEPEETRTRLSQTADVFRTSAPTHRNPSAYETGDARLLYYSTEGCMLSVPTLISNLITIKYHDNSQEMIEIKDEQKCTLGSFYRRRFAISNGSVVNFNNEWTKEGACRLLGITDRFVFVFAELLTAYDFSGRIVAEACFFDAYTFCCSPTQLAVFSPSSVTVIDYEGPEMNMSNSRAIPVPSVSFAAFYSGSLWAAFRESLFRLDGAVLVKQCRLPGIPLALYDDFVLTLPNPPVLLPRPVVDYTKIKPGLLVMQAEEPVGAASRYDILRTAK